MSYSARVTIGILLSAWVSLPAQAALVTSTSENLSGSPAPEIRAETFDGQSFTLPTGAGKAVCINFFASWCPVCQAENQELREIQVTYAERGMNFIGVLVDPVETPDTLEEARQGLKRKPLPYPVILMDENLRASFQYVGFPATYFITSDGTFSTTLYGYHPRGKIAEVAERVLLGSAPTTERALTVPLETAAPSGAPSARGPSSSEAPELAHPNRGTGGVSPSQARLPSQPNPQQSAPPPERVPTGTQAAADTAERSLASVSTRSTVELVQPAPWSKSPLLALVPSTRKQVHPLIVHFPIAFLGLELLLVMAYLAWPRDSLQVFSHWLLWSAALSLVPSIYTGIGDVGADLGPGWAFWNGLQDRLHHFTRLESTVSLHVLFVLLTASLVLIRLAWRIFFGEKALEGRKRFVFAVLALLGFWALFAAGQVGGSISHP